MIMKKSSLSDSEFVLFIDHDQSEIRESYIVLQDRLCTDDDLDVSVCDLFFHVRFFLRCSTSFKKIDSDTEW